MTSLRFAGIGRDNVFIFGKWKCVCCCRILCTKTIVTTLLFIIFCYFPQCFSFTILGIVVDVRPWTTTTTYSHLFFSFCVVIRTEIQATYVRSHANFVSSWWWFFSFSSSFVCLLLYCDLGISFVLVRCARLAMKEKGKKKLAQREATESEDIIRIIICIYFPSFNWLSETLFFRLFVLFCAGIFFLWTKPEHHMCAVVLGYELCARRLFICRTFCCCCFCLVFIHCEQLLKSFMAVIFCAFCPATSPYCVSLLRRRASSTKILISFERIRFSRIVGWMPLNKWLHRLSFSSFRGNCLLTEWACQSTDITSIWIIQLVLHVVAELDTSDGLILLIKLLIYLITDWKLVRNQTHAIFHFKKMKTLFPFCTWVRSGRRSKVVTRNSHDR